MRLLEDMNIKIEGRGRWRLVDGKGRSQGYRSKRGEGEAQAEGRKGTFKGMKRGPSRYSLSVFFLSRL